MSTPFGLELARLCKARLGEITDADIAALTEFAERRLVEIGVPPSYGEDVTQRALHAVLHGLEKNQGGRQAAPGGCQRQNRFLKLPARDRFSSLLYSMTRTCGFRTTQQWDDSAPSPDAGRPSPANEAALRDLGEQLFRRLRARARGGCCPRSTRGKQYFSPAIASRHGATANTCARSKTSPQQVLRNWAASVNENSVGNFTTPTRDGSFFSMFTPHRVGRDRISFPKSGRSVRSCAVRWQQRPPHRRINEEVNVFRYPGRWPVTP